MSVVIDRGPGPSNEKILSEYLGAYLQIVTVFEKQVVSADATAINLLFCHAIATDLLA